jgi:hypothetical protein
LGLIELVHKVDIGENNGNKAKNRPLLGKPKAEFKTPNLNRV